MKTHLGKTVQFVVLTMLAALVVSLSAIQRVQAAFWAADSPMMSERYSQTAGLSCME